MLIKSGIRFSVYYSDQDNLLENYVFSEYKKEFPLLFSESTFIGDF